MKIGFIGLGTMGLPMAKCLQLKGFKLLGWDINTVAMAQLAQGCDSIEQLARDSETIVTMLPEGEHLRTVYGQLLAANVHGKRLFIDCSTIDIETTRELADDVRSQGHGFVDAPASGGAEAARRFEAFIESNDSNLDFSAIYRSIRK